MESILLLFKSVHGHQFKKANTFVANEFLFGCLSRTNLPETSSTSPVAPEGGAFSTISCKIFLNMVGHLSLFACTLLKTNPHLYPGWGGQDLL